MRSMLSIDDVAKRSKAELKAMGVDDAQTFVDVSQRAKDMGVTFSKAAYEQAGATDGFIGKLQYLAQITGYTDKQRQAALLLQYQQIQATKGQTEATAWLNTQNDESAARFMKVIGGAAA